MNVSFPSPFSRIYVPILGYEDGEEADREREREVNVGMFEKMMQEAHFSPSLSDSRF